MSRQILVDFLNSSIIMVHLVFVYNKTTLNACRVLVPMLDIEGDEINKEIELSYMTLVTASAVMMYLSVLSTNKILPYGLATAALILTSYRFVITLKEYMVNKGLPDVYEQNRVHTTFDFLTNVVIVTYALTIL